MRQCGLWDGHLPLSDYNPAQRQTENGGCAWTLVCLCRNGEGKDVRWVRGASLTWLHLIRMVAFQWRCGKAAHKRTDLEDGKGKKSPLTPCPA